MTMPLPHVRTCEPRTCRLLPPTRQVVYRRLLPSGVAASCFQCGASSTFTTAKAPVASDIDGRLLPTETCTTHAAANNYSWLMEHGPVDWVMRSRGVVETWDFASDQCRELHHQCVARPPSLWTERCEQRLHACLRVIATRDDCLTVLDACVFVSNGSLRIGLFHQKRALSFVVDVVWDGYISRECGKYSAYMHMHMHMHMTCT